MVTYVLSQLSHVSYESGYLRLLLFYKRPAQLITLLVGSETEDQFSLILR